MSLSAFNLLFLSVTQWSEQHLPLKVDCTDANTSSSHQISVLLAIQPVTESSAVCLLIDDTGSTSTSIITHRLWRYIESFACNQVYGRSTLSMAKKALFCGASINILLWSVAVTWCHPEGSYFNEYIFHDVGEWLIKGFVRRLISLKRTSIKDANQTKSTV